jgi:hypothetical protein
MADTPIETSGRNSSRSGQTCRRFVHTTWHLFLDRLDRSLETVSGLFLNPYLIGRSHRPVGIGSNAESIPVVTSDGSMPLVVEEFPLMLTELRLSLCIFISLVITLLTRDLRPACAAGRPDHAGLMMSRWPLTQATVPLMIHAYPVLEGVDALFATHVFWKWSVNWVRWLSTPVTIAEILHVSSKNSRSGLSHIRYSWKILVIGTKGKTQCSVTVSS